MMNSSLLPPKYDPNKKDLPKRSDYVGAISWLKAISDSLGGNVVFALDEALMCSGSFGGTRSSGGGGGGGRAGGRR